MFEVLFLKAAAKQGLRSGRRGSSLWAGRLRAVRPPLPPASATRLCSISTDFMNVYYQIRSSQLDRSIRGLKEHFRKSSSSSGVPYSPAVPNKRKDTPTKKPAKRPGEPLLAHLRSGHEAAWAPATSVRLLGCALVAAPAVKALARLPGPGQ